MFLFIFESIGTSELVLIGIVALIFLGPRRMPEYARKIGKIMADLRSTTNEFKETWQREVNFEEEVKAFRIDDDEPAKPQAPSGSMIAVPPVEQVTAPEIREVEPATMLSDTTPGDLNPTEKSAANTVRPEFDPNDRRNWL